MKKNIFILLSIFILINPCPAADDSKVFPSLSIIPYEVIPYEPSLNIKHTDNGFGEIANCGYTTPEFVKAVQTSTDPLDILEIGPGDGRVLKELLSTSIKQPFTYHSVDLSKECRTKINRVIKAHGKNSKNKFEIYVSDVFQFLAGKKEKYNIILMNNVSHYYSPLQQIDLFQKIHTSLKANGKLYMCQCSILSAEIWAADFSNKELHEKFIEHFKNQKLKGDLWPGYIVSGELAKQIRTYTLLCKTKKTVGKWDHPTLHSAQTLSDLLTSIGFSVSEAFDFTEHAYQDTMNTPQAIALPSIRVGIIAQKRNDQNDEKTILYKSAALSKQAELELLMAQITADTSPGKSIGEKIIKEQMLLKVLQDIQLLKAVSTDINDLTDITTVEGLLAEYTKHPNNTLYEKIQTILDRLTKKLLTIVLDTKQK